MIGYTNEMITFYERAFKGMANIDFDELNPCNTCERSCKRSMIECPQLLNISSKLCIKYTGYLKFLEPNIPVSYVVTLCVTAGGVTDVILQSVGDFKVGVEATRREIKSKFEPSRAREMCRGLDQQVNAMLAIEPLNNSMFKFIELLSKYKGGQS